MHHAATTEIYTLSLHDALPISPKRASPGIGLPARSSREAVAWRRGTRTTPTRPRSLAQGVRSEEHTSELQSRGHLVCRLLLEKKKTHASPELTYQSSATSNSVS